MNIDASTWATRLIAHWVHLYTSGAPAAAREARRAEILSDVWEHQSFAQAAGQAPDQLTWAIAGRCLRGIPADLAWRLRLKGEVTMLSKSVIERSTGVLLVLVTGFLVLGFALGRFGIGAALPYFEHDFPELARDPRPLATSLVIMAVASLIVIVTAAALYLTFRPHEPALATLGAFGLLAAGILLLVTTGAGRALFDLAGEWHAAGRAPNDAIWAAARAVALIFEYLGMIAMLLLIGSLMAFGLVILRNAMLPRWLGGLAALSGLSVVLGVALMPVHELFFGLAALGVLVGLLWFLITGVWLLLRGTGEAPQPRVGPA